MKILKTVLSVIFTGVLSCYGQEMSRYKSLYKFDMMRDTIAMEYFSQDTYVLQIGENITKGYIYRDFYIDSLKIHDPVLHNRLFSASVQQDIE